LAKSKEAAKSDPSMRVFVNADVQMLVTG